MKRTLPTRHAALVMLSLSACALPDKNLGEVAATDTDVDPTASSGSSGDGMTSNASSPETGGETTGEVPSGCAPGEPHSCGADEDRDGFDLACDNAKDVFNPDQS